MCIRDRRKEYHQPITLALNCKHCGSEGMHFVDHSSIIMGSGWKICGAGPKFGGFFSRVFFEFRICEIQNSDFFIVFTESRGGGLAYST
eukprot:6489954-Amphidinium_carterae.1